MTVTIVNIESKRIGDYDLNPRQAKALPLVLSGMSNKDVATAVQVNVCTVSDWINHHAGFKQALSAETDRTLDRARRKLAATVVDAVDTLADTVRTGSGSANRTKAAIVVLDKAGVVGPTEGIVPGTIDPQVAALANLIHQRRAEELLGKEKDDG